MRLRILSLEAELRLGEFREVEQSLSELVGSGKVSGATAERLAFIALRAGHVALSDAFVAKSGSAQLAQGIAPLRETVTNYRGGLDASADDRVRKVNELQLFLTAGLPALALTRARELYGEGFDSVAPELLKRLFFAALSADDDRAARTLSAQLGMELPLHATLSKRMKAELAALVPGTCRFADEL
jgi:hypothetical protein